MIGAKQVLNMTNQKNISIWNNNNALVDVNFLINILNDAGHNLQKIKSYKSFKYFAKNPTIRTISYNNKYVFDETFEGDQLTYDHFKAHNTIIIKACTGTGSNLTSKIEKEIN